MTKRREEILAAFICLAERYGIDKTTMQDLATEAGISVGTIYNDFANKEELIGAYCERMGTLAVQAIDTWIANDESADELLRNVILKHIERFNKITRNNRGFGEIAKDVHNFRYIGKKMLGIRNLVKRELVLRINMIMERGVEQGVFRIDDIPQAARLFLDAFGEYWSPPLVFEREHDIVMQDARAMVDFLLKALTNFSHS